ncbi:MAG: Hsp70 family protein [Hyphomicrobiaceae bacterium]|nr:Hsp70 family protein [Hyphomicrobiaceae bacterium]
MTNAPRACGLDFGTSNSAIGHAAATHPALIPLQEGRVSIPTAVFFSFEDTSITFGREAVSRYLERESGRLMRSLKSVLGSSLIDELTQVGRQRLRFDEIISLFLGYVRDGAGGPTAVVMGRPVHFVDDDEEADRNAENQLRQAAQLAGFRHIEFQLEPIAAALDYERQVSAEELAFVVDIGGGTSDFSIVRVSPERRGRPDRQSDILGYSGVHIGGTDFDRRLELDAVLPHLGFGAKLQHKGMETPSWWYQDLATWQRINFLYDQKIFADIRRVRRDLIEPEKLDRLLGVLEGRKGHALLAAVEDGKIRLSSADRVEVDLNGLAGIAPVVMTRAQLERAIADQIGRIDATIRATLSESNVAADAIGCVFLTGGSSHLPVVRATLRTAFPEARILEGDAFGSVATGLALEAYTRFGSASR